MKKAVIGLVALLLIVAPGCACRDFKHGGKEVYRVDSARVHPLPAIKPLLEGREFMSRSGKSTTALT